MLTSVNLPDGTEVSNVAYNTTRVTVQNWIEKSESDVDYLALLVAISAWSRNPSQLSLKQEYQAMIKDWFKAFPLHQDTIAVIANCLALNEAGSGFVWNRPE